MKLYLTTNKILPTEIVYRNKPASLSLVFAFMLCNSRPLQSTNHTVSVRTLVIFAIQKRKMMRSILKMVLSSRRMQPPSIAGGV